MLRSYSPRARPKGSTALTIAPAVCQDGEPRFTTLPKGLVVFWALILATIMLSVVVAILGHQAHRPDTQWDPFSDPLLGDLMEYPATYQSLHSAAFFSNAGHGAMPRGMFSAVAYPPFAAAVLAPLYLAVDPLWGFLSLAAAWLTVAYWGTRSVLRKNGFSAAKATLFPLSLLTASFPVARLVHQGNIELVVWILVAAGLWAFLQHREMTPAVMWGLAAALKLYPAVLLLLFLPRRKTGALLVGVAVGTGVTVLSLWWLGPTIIVAWRGSLQHVFGYQDLRASEWSLRELVANHSWFSWTKLLAQLFQLPLPAVLLPYTASGAALLAAAGRRLWAMPVTNQVLGLTVFMLGFPSVSYFHTLVHLYFPLVILVCVAMQAHRTGASVLGLHATLLLFVPLFAPYTLLLYPRALLFSGLLQSLSLWMLFLCALQFPFHGSAFEFCVKDFSHDADNEGSEEE